MGRRREGREAAVQFLFAHELHAEHSDEEKESFWSLHMAKKGAREYALELIKGVLTHLPEIDARIESTAENYRIERLANVDRNVLRLAVYELLFVPEAPPPVVINEAIEIAKKYGATESGGFVNGLLDRIANGPKRSPAPQIPASEPTIVS
jgi:N utilization substance protein B